jgi:hypothetical protein
MSPKTAYALRARADASTFRQAWDVALDYAIRRIGDAAFSRALHGVSRPVFYQGEQIGERRHYDERLVMFLLRYRDPVRYGAWLDGYEARRHPDGTGIVLAHALNSVLDAAHGQEAVVKAPTQDAAGDPITGPHAVPPSPTARSSPSVRCARIMTGRRICANCSKASALTATLLITQTSSAIRPSTIGGRFSPSAARGAVPTSTCRDLRYLPRATPSGGQREHGSARNAIRRRRDHGARACLPKPHLNALFVCGSHGMSRADPGVETGNVRVRCNVGQPVTA